MTSGASMISTTNTAYSAQSIGRFELISTAFQGEQALGLEHDDRDHDAEHHGAGENVVGSSGDQPVDLAENARGEHRAQETADAAHHDDEEAVDHHRRTHVGKH